MGVQIFYIKVTPPPPNKFHSRFPHIYFHIKMILYGLYSMKVVYLLHVYTVYFIKFIHFVIKW